MRTPAPPHQNAVPHWAAVKTPHIAGPATDHPRWHRLCCVRPRSSAELATDATPANRSGATLRTAPTKCAGRVQSGGICSPFAPARKPLASQTLTWIKRLLTRAKSQWRRNSPVLTRTNLEFVEIRRHTNREVQAVKKNSVQFSLQSLLICCIVGTAFFALNLRSTVTSGDIFLSMDFPQALQGTQTWRTG